MITINKKENCSGCSACYSACPKNAIKMVADVEGFLYPQVDKTLCIDCGLCNKVCPIENKKPQIQKQPKAYAGKYNDDFIRHLSSSGGIFTAIATYVLGKGGVVFGVVFNDDFSVSHKAVECEEDLGALRGSKYLQSRIEDTYLQAEKYLKDGRLVLFTGTPCQVGGLLSYLRKSYDNLITQDLICHGTPSPDVWQKYVQYRAAQAGAKANKISFRNKENGWKRFSMSFDFENNNEYICSAGHDYFIRAFLSNICLRPSCYACSFKTVERNADITLADFWGIQNVLPDMDDDKGTSLILVHTEKGMRILEELNDKIDIKEVDVGCVTKCNSSVCKSAIRHKKRDCFLKEINSQNFDKVVKKYCRISLKTKIKKIIKRLIGRK